MRTLRRPARDAPGTRARAILWPVVAILGLVLVAAAALSRPVRFTGPRWLPHSNPHRLATPSVSVTTSTGATARALPRPVMRHGTLSIASIVSWILLAAVIVLAIILIRRWFRQRPARHATGLDQLQQVTAMPPLDPPTPTAPVEPEHAAPALRTGVEQALELLDADLEPADAVLQAWLGLQRSAEQSGIVRRAAETPTEFTTRITARVFADDAAIRILLQRYLQVRFGQHAVTADDVAAVRTALTDLAGTWNTRIPGRAH